MANPSPPYFEGQRGGNCRIHAVNMALGGRAISAEELSGKWCRIFSEVYAVPDAMPYDYVSQDGLTVAAFAAERAHSGLFALGLHHPSARTVYGFAGIKPLYNIAKGVCTACLISNRSHVWAARPGWLLDSMRRPRRLHCMSAAFGSHHVTLLLDRSRCWPVVRQLVSRGISAVRRGRSWSDVLPQLYKQPEPGSTEYRQHVMGMLGALFHLVAVGIRADTRCEHPPLQDLASLRKTIVDSYRRCALEPEHFASTWSRILARFEQSTGDE